MLWQILSRCPLIEYLNLAECSIETTKTYNVSKLHNLETLIVEPYSFHQNVFVEFGKCQFLNLTHLVLTGVDIGTAFFNNLAYKFPCLEDLILKLVDHGRYENIRISSLSIKCLRFSVPRDVVLQIDKFEVPNVSKFILSCYDTSSVSFTAVTKQMESEINIYWCSYEFPEFLANLRNLVRDLCQSKISLNISFSDYQEFSSMRFENTGIPNVVENLTVSSDRGQMFTLSKAECGLLWCLRPKFIIINILNSCDKTPIEVLHEKLIEQVNQNRLNSVFSTQHLGYLYDLKEVSAEVFENSVMEWQPVKILYCGNEQLRFKLKWGALTPEHTIVTFAERPELLFLDHCS